MKKFFILVIFSIVGLGQIFAQNYTKPIPRPVGCHGSGAIINEETGEVLLRVDEPPYIFTQRVKMEVTFHKNAAGETFFVAPNGRLYPVKGLSLYWQKVANVDNRYLAGEEFNWVHYGHWLYRRPLKLFI